MIDELVLGKGNDKVIIKNCFFKLKHFCEYDAFPRYDLEGYKYLNQSNVFQKVLLTAMNREMMARSPKKVWEPFLDRPLDFLADIPVDVDLIDSSDEIYFEARKKMHAYYLKITNTNWITDMAASKMLYLKRPTLSAISDSYVRTMLHISDPDTREHPYRSPFYSNRALTVCDEIRKIGQENILVLKELQARISPTIISKVRMIDIMIWVEMAIAQNHQMWSMIAKLNKW